MATYTDNYQLTKPTYAEQADISVINSNMNIIDDIMHSSQISLAPAYDQSQTYAEGDVVMYELLMYKCISPTTGVWDASKWERTTASESGGGGSAELDILGEASGAVASFSDGASAELAKCIADVNPKQDLHGYDKPWAGGTGKNIFGYEESATDETATYRSNINQQLIISKVTENEIKCNYNNGNYSEGYLVISGIDGTLSYSVSYTIKEKTVTYNPDIIKDTANSDSTKLVLKVRGNNGTNVVGNTEYVTFTNIQVESGTSITSFEPYSNICPISGSTSVTVTISDGETSTTKTTPLGQTVYGGQLNVLTGELTIEHVQYVFDGSERIVTQNAGWGTNVLDNTIKPNINNNTMSDILCDIFSPETPSHVWNHTSDNIIGIAVESDNYKIRFYSSAFVGKTSSEVATEMTGHMLVYPLATPQTVQLTPQEVNSLLGQNNISADTGDVDIVYVKASAPIQPNPTGTPTATLKKLGIDGTVFELEDGGGGSSGEIHYSTTEQVIGTWIDGKPLYQITIEVHNLVSGNNTVSHNIANLKMVVENISFLIDNNSYTNQLPAISTVSGWSARARDFGLTTFVIELGSEIARYYTDAIVTMFYTKITD